MSSSSRFLMVGLKASGKTSYLAALWHFLESGEIADDIFVPELQPDRDYLNSVRNSWLALKPLGRTSMRTRATASLKLEHRQTGAKIDLTIPDLSGESFRLQWFTRKAPHSYVDFAKGCSGAFLFIHPNDFRRTHAIKPESVDSNDGDEPELGGTIPVSENWTPEQSATQVQLVDIVQLLVGLRQSNANMRIAVIISAWDVVSKQISPSSWLESRLPLLSQYLRSNDDWLSSEVFGVSSQGGDLTDDRDRLLDTAAASARCYAVSGKSADPVSMTAPLRYLLDL